MGHWLCPVVSGIYVLLGVLIQQGAGVRRNVQQVGDQGQHFDFAVVIASEPDLTQWHLRDADSSVSIGRCAAVEVKYPTRLVSIPTARR